MCGTASAAGACSWRLSTRRQSDGSTRPTPSRHSRHIAAISGPAHGASPPTSFRNFASARAGHRVYEPILTVRLYYPRSRVAAQHFLDFLPLPHGHGSFLPSFGIGPPILASIRLPSDDFFAPLPESPLAVSYA